MKIFQWIILGITLIVSQTNTAQDASPSPYSFFGLGDTSFRGTAENFGMGGLHFYTDSIHYTVNTPASLARLQFVNLSLGLGNHFIKVSDASDSQWFSTHGVSYFSLGIPIGKKFGIGFGLLPVSSAGYQIKATTENGIYSYEGKGGNSRFFFAGAYQYKGFSFGMEYQYYFGYLDHQNNWFPTNSITYSRENNQVDFAGSALKFSLSHRYRLNKKNYIDVSANYRLSGKLDASYKKHLRLITVTAATGEQMVEEIENSNVPGTINLPSELDFGVGYGEKNKWFVGAEYNFVGLKEFRNPFYDTGLISYDNAQTFRLGANLIPKYNSITKYWKRITYRFGGYYKNTGMLVHNQTINDFGITFGLSLPSLSLRGISKLNIGVAAGQRGKISPKLVKENYINLQISLSLNDKWFIKRKIN